MRETRRITCLALLAFAIAGCSQFAIHTSRDPGADFSRLHTYAWLPLSEAEPADQRVADRYIDARIRSAVAKELAAKGYRPAGSAAPDFLLNYRLASTPDEAISGRSYGLWWGAWASADGFYRESYDAGTLHFAVIDGATKRTMWLGAASARLLPHISLKKRAKRVDDAVHQIFARFPGEAR